MRRVRSHSPGSPVCAGGRNVPGAKRLGSRCAENMGTVRTRLDQDEIGFHDGVRDLSLDGRSSPLPVPPVRRLRCEHGLHQRIKDVGSRDCRIIGERSGTGISAEENPAVEFPAERLTALRPRTGPRIHAAGRGPQCGTHDPRPDTPSRLPSNPWPSAPHRESAGRAQHGYRGVPDSSGCPPNRAKEEGERSAAAYWIGPVQAAEIARAAIVIAICLGPIMSCIKSSKWESRSWICWIAQRWIRLLMM